LSLIYEAIFIPLLRRHTEAGMPRAPGWLER
jgi:hypothetical protein